MSDIIKNPEWEFLYNMTKKTMGKQWCVESLGNPIRQQWDQVGEFQFNPEKQTARIVFGDDKKTIVAKIDLKNPMATGLAVISAFTKNVLND